MQVQKEEEKNQVTEQTADEYEFTEKEVGLGLARSIL